MILLLRVLITLGAVWALWRYLDGWSLADEFLAAETDEWGWR